MAQLLPMSVEMIASSGMAAMIARQAWRGLIRSGSRARARAFQVTPSSVSSSWSIELSSWAQRDLVRAIRSRRACRPASPAPGASASSSCSATFRASPWIATSTFLVRPMRSGLISTWMILAVFGQ